VRAVLGDKTTNAKAKGLQGVSVKSAVREIEKTQARAPTAVRPKAKQPAVETQKLQIHVETADQALEEEIEFCGPRPTDLPYESDVFPDGVLSFEGLKPENLFRGFYQYYHNPVDEDGVSQTDRELAEKNRKALEECTRQVQQDLDTMDWSIGDMADLKLTTKPLRPQPGVATKQSRRPVSATTSRKAAKALAIDDGTRSMQRSRLQESLAGLPKKRAAFLPVTRNVRQPSASAGTKTASSGASVLDANSRTTLGYNKGREAASVLASRSTKTVSHAVTYKHKAASLPLSETTSSTGSERTITPARYAASSAVEDEAWKQRIPFLSIFEQEDDEDDFDLLGTSNSGSALGGLDEIEEDFELKMPE
jgi:hypothetical protein